MRIFGNVNELRKNLENSSIVKTYTGYDMSKDVEMFKATLVNDWENLPKGIFLVRHWRGSPKNYTGYFKGGNYLKHYVVTEIIFYDNGEIEFVNDNEKILINYEALHNGNDYDVILKKLTY